MGWSVWGGILACTHATVMEGSLGDDTWQREAVGAAGGAGAPWVRPHPGAASPRPPSAWRLYVGPGPLPRGFWAQIRQVSGPSLYLFKKSLRLCFSGCTF
jgi:hypothetical protein